MIRIATIDDMPKARKMLKMLLEKIEGVEVVAEFGDAISAIEYLQKETVDLVFLDIEMPEMNGLEAVGKIHELEQAPEVVFLTAYSEYVIDAWKTEAMSYVLKPFMLQDIKDVITLFKSKRAKIETEIEIQIEMQIQARIEAKVEELEQRPYITNASELEESIDQGHSVKKGQKKNIQIVCFPVFNVFVDDQPLVFRNKKAKEIMAYLVHCKGGWVEINDLCANVLEGMESEKAKNNIRTYINRLKVILESEGIRELVEHVYGKLRIDSSQFECDYYQYLDGESQLFTGEYLLEYSWAEPTLAMMVIKK